jgi:uncharacterized membrane protein YfcA
VEYISPVCNTSIPGILGGLISVDPVIYRKVLGICLLIAVFRMVFFFDNKSVDKKSFSFWAGLIIGAVFGLISGVIGIGGGIFLSPLLRLMNWAEMKETAAISALFIFVNSIAGMTGILTTGEILHPQIFIFVIAAAIGGLAGSHFGSIKLPEKILNTFFQLYWSLVLSCFRLIISMITVKAKEKILDNIVLFVLRRYLCNALKSDRERYYLPSQTRCLTNPLLMALRLDTVICGFKP